MMILSQRPKDMPLIFRPTFKLTALAVMIILTIAMLLWIPDLLSSFLMTIILVFIFSPAVDYFERHGITRINAILLVMLGVLLVMILLGMLLSSYVFGEYEGLSSRIDFYSSMLNDEINRRVVELERKFGLERFEVGQKVLSHFQDELHQAVLFTGATFGTVVTWIALVPLMLFFFLLDGHLIKRALIGFLPNRYFEMSLNIHEKISKIVGNFIRAKLIESGLVGAISLVGFIIIGIIYRPLNYAFVLALLVGLFNIIPYLGPLIGMIPVLLVAVVQYVLLPQFPEFGSEVQVASNWAPVAWIFGVVTFSHIVDNVYIIPVLLGHAVNVHALVVLLSVIVGAKLLGITGMIISIPLASILQTLVFEVADGIRNLRH